MHELEGQRVNALAIDGFATEEGTRAFAERATKQNEIPNSHFRLFDGLTLTSLGIGTYLGDADIETDLLVAKAVEESVKSGAINLIDTAINYRFQKAERSVGVAIKNVIEDGTIKRDQVFISTKNGYLTNDGDLGLDFWRYINEYLVKPGTLKHEDISSGMHCMALNYLRDQLQRSLRNLSLECVDLMFIHNAAESQIPDIGKEEFLSKLQDAFGFYEDMRKEGKIRYYGMATWTCFRVPQKDPTYLSLQEVIAIARRVGGENHGFRFIQLPFNLAMNEGFTLKNQLLNGEMYSTLEAAQNLGIGVFTSVPLMQGKLLNSRTLPKIEGIEKPSLKCLQIVRSAPGVIAPMVGQKDTGHVQENLQIARFPIMSHAEFSSFMMSPLIE